MSVNTGMRLSGRRAVVAQGGKGRSQGARVGRGWVTMYLGASACLAVVRRHVCGELQAFLGRATLGAGIQLQQAVRAGGALRRIQMKVRAGVSAR